MRVLPALFAALAALSSPAFAAGDCSMARHVSQLDVASKLLLAETRPKDAAKIVGRLTTLLQMLREASPPSIRTAAGNPTQRMQAYIGTREAMVEVYEREGLGAAKAYLRSAPVTAIDATVRNIEALLDCAGKTETIPDTAVSAAGSGQQGTDGPLRHLLGHRRTPAEMLRQNGIVPAAAALFLLAFGALSMLFMNRRAHTRHACDIPALVVIRGETILGRIANISRGGAKICATNEIHGHPRCTVLLEDGTSLSCKVVWSNSHFIGVNFQPKLDYSPRKLFDALGGTMPEPIRIAAPGLPFQTFKT